MIRRFSSLVAAIVLLLVASWLFRDAATMALRAKDPESGRGRGCYTDLEIILDVQAPTGWVRPIEFVLAGVFGVWALRIFLRKGQS
jgi:hypothetical protein